MMRYYWNVLILSAIVPISFSYAENKIVSVQNKQEFDRLLSKATKPAVVLFHSGCPVCKATKGHFTNMTSKYPITVIYLEVNINILPELATKYDITSLPTVLIFQVDKPKPAQRLVGPDRETLSSAIDTVLKS